MTGITQYWRHVCKLAWRDTRGELGKALAKFAATSVIIGLVIFVGADAIGVDRLFVAAAIPLAALFSFAAKLIVIPARLHRAQAAREDARSVALNLERLYAEGQLLRTDSAAGSVRWFDPRVLDWEQQVIAVLRPYNEEERLMFETIHSGGAYSLPLDPTAFVPWSQARLAAKLEKLRRITARAYGKAGAASSVSEDPQE